MKLKVNSLLCLMAAIFVLLSSCSIMPQSSSEITSEVASRAAGVSEWEGNVYYPVGTIVSYEGKYYECLQAHTSLAPNWTPVYAHSLWKLYTGPINDTQLGDLTFNSTREAQVKALYEEWKAKYIFYVEEYSFGGGQTPGAIQTFDGAYVYFNGPSSWNWEESPSNQTQFSGANQRGYLYGSHSENPYRMLVSEAQAYGMLAAAQLDDERTFEQLFNFYMMFTDSDGLMNWSINLRADYDADPDTRYFPSYDTSRTRPRKTLIGRDNFVMDVEGSLGPATDGDMDIAYALILADRQGWGNGKYATQAQKVLEAIRGDVIHSEYKHLKISNQGEEGVPSFHDNWENFAYDRVVRTSDFQLVNILTFKEFDSNHSDVWQEVYDTTIKIIADVTSDKGLFPDFAYYDNGTYKPLPTPAEAQAMGWSSDEIEFMESEHDGEYNFNACRTPWRLSAPLMGDVDTPELTTALTSWLQFAEDDANLFDGRLTAGYKLDGTPLADYSSMLFDAPKMTVSLGLDDSDFSTYWDTYVVDCTGTTDNWDQIGSVNSQVGFYNYYDDSVRLLSAINAAYDKN